MPAVELATAYISLVPSMKGVQGEVSRQLAPVSKEADKQGKKAGGRFSKAFGSSTGKLVAAAGGLAIFTQVTGFLKDANAEAREAQKVGAVTTQVIKSTGGAAKVTASQVGDLASSISAKVGMDDEAIQSGANLLLTFKNVRNEAGKGSDIFNRATQAATDLSAAGFGSVESSSKMLGKALNDPLKGLTALGRAGVTFTKAQEDQIKKMVESGDILGAQKKIMKEVESQVGGVAEAQATAGDKLTVSWGNFQEMVGTMLLPVMDKLAVAGTKVLTWMQANPGVIKTMAIAFGILGVALFAVTSPIAVVGAAIGGLIALFGYLYTKNQTFKKVVDVVWKAVGKVVGFYWSRVLKPTMQALWRVLTTVVIPAMRSLGRWVVDVWRTKIAPAWSAMKTGAKSLWESIVRAKDRIVAGFDRIRAGVARVKDAFATARNGIGSAWSKIGEVIRKPLGIAVRALNTFLAGLDTLMGKVSGGKLGIDFRITGAAAGWKDGGYTGNKPANAIAGVVHGDEHVIRSPARRALESTNPGALDYMNRTGRWPGYNGGGRVVWPARGTSSRHSGYPWASWAGDINQPGTIDYGAPVVAYRDGKVASTNRWGHSYGNHIRLNHPGNGSTLYAHLSQIAVRAGQSVTAGQLIGRVGNTGNSFGPHLHFEVMGGAAKVGAGGGGGGLMGAVTSALDKIGGVGKFNKLVGKLKGSLDVAGDSPIAKMMKGIPSRLRDGAWDWVKDKLNPFDSGGIASGKGFMPKNTIRPERVLSPRQTQAFESAMSGGFGGGVKEVRLARARVGIDDLGGYIEGIAQVVFDNGMAYDAQIGGM